MEPFIKELEDLLGDDTLISQGLEQLKKRLQGVSLDRELPKPEKLIGQYEFEAAHQQLDSMVHLEMNKMTQIS